MTEKLLEKPPFRYLHDIFTATMEAVPGFANGLYADVELDSKNINERDAKITFLSKMIALVEIMTQETIDCKPAKIVAGLEPEKTNEFL
jgi:TRAF3-interacting protein 1